MRNLNLIGGEAPENTCAGDDIIRELKALMRDKMAKTKPGEIVLAHGAFAGLEMFLCQELFNSIGQLRM